MEKVRVELNERSYDITIGSDILSEIGDRLAKYKFSPRIAIISNPTVFGSFGAVVLSSLKKAGFDCIPIIIPDGEEYKDYFWTYHILTELLKNRLDRNSAIIALGGGVIGDIAGFAASIYMRGIHFAQVPTTLLSQVDSSVGGKTGVNHYLGKNMVGSFYQPKLVWIDIQTLKTLPKREVLCGIAEIIKYGVIWDEELFGFLRKNKAAILEMDPDALKYIIKRSCEIKAEVVSKDERETGLRAILNYGHTIGHAIETATGYRRYLHGEAIAIGMSLEARLSAATGLLKDEDETTIKETINSFGLPSDLPNDIKGSSLIPHMELDKKVVGGEMRFILPEKIGSVRIQRGIDKMVLEKCLSKN
ncbi:MAG: 3-dehydroquinate synthase [Nitrospirae bacterium]|nr:3-dehydroquinate synthase [Nitrospirota bacterium]